MVVTDSHWRRRRQRHREMLIISVAVLIASLLLRVNSNDRVALPFLENHPLPESCPSWILFQTPCPGCGLTRSFIHLAHGNVSASLARHRIGVLLFVLLVLQIPYRIFALRHPTRELIAQQVSSAIATLLIVLLIGNWAIERATALWAGS